MIPDITRFKSGSRKGRLFVNTSDRPVEFTLEFEHMHSQTAFLVRGITQYDENRLDNLPGESRFDNEEDDVVALWDCLLEMSC